MKSNGIRIGLIIRKHKRDDNIPELTNYIEGFKILGVSEISVNRNVVEQELVGETGNYFTEGDKEVTAKLTCEISNSTNLGDLGTTVPYLKIMGNNKYYLLIDVLVSGYDINVNNNGPMIAEVDIVAKDIIMYENFDVEFKDGTIEVDPWDYFKIKDNFYDPEKMTFNEFKKCLVVEAL